MLILGVIKKMSKELSGKQKRCIELMLEGELLLKDIAEELGVTPKTISTWKKDETFIEVYEEAVKSALRYSAVKAMGKVEKLMDSSNDFVALYAAQDVLNRAGFKPTDKMELTEKAAPVIVDDIPEGAE